MILYEISNYFDMPRSLYEVLFGADLLQIAQFTKSSQITWPNIHLPKLLLLYHLSEML